MIGYESMIAKLAELQALRFASNTRLLVVDDEPLILASLEALLKHKHYQVDTALGGKLACQQLEQNHYDLVLLDLNMADVDGFAVMAFMADQGIDAAIVVVSGESTFDAVRKALRMGASDYVKKPYSPEELFATIDLTLHKNTWRIDGRVAKVRLLAKDTPIAELPMVDAQKMLHELEVHQIELEMQNESLLEARDAEKLALHRYTELFDFAPVGYFILDPTSKITQVNLKGTNLLGIEKSNLAGRLFLVYIALEYRVIFCDFLANAFDSCDKQNCEILVQVGKHDLWLSIEANIGASATECLVAMIDITERKQAEGQLERMAHYDRLTDLPNRVLLVDRINQGMVQCQRRNLSLAVAYLDLDGFKIVNDTHGHHVGDELLIAISQRIKEALREGDTLARIGGDEFIAVMIDLERIEDSEPLLKRLLKAAAEPVIIGDAVMQVSASIGVTHYPQDDASADHLIRHADKSMYVSKQTGKNRYHLFDPEKDIMLF
jgi:diguanylate cyclase (GGDEF)-like protein/PAS domain S-box-containing protein